MKTILFVEDESVLQKTVRDTLEQEGYKVVSALDGETGLRLANPADEKNKPDLILLDLILPKINGFDVLKNLKEKPVTQNIPVIVLTNLEGMKDIEKTIDAGATTYLVKANYTLEEVLEKVKNILD